MLKEKFLWWVGLVVVVGGVGGGGGSCKPIFLSNPQPSKYSAKDSLNLAIVGSHKIKSHNHNSLYFLRFALTATWQKKL